MAAPTPHDAHAARVRRILIALLLVAVSCASLVLLAVQLQPRSDDPIPLVFPDFMVFWAAGPTMRDLGITTLFDTAAFTAHQNALFASLLKAPLMVRPWLYPPSFLLIASQFAALPFLMSAWVVQGGGALALWGALQRRTGRWLLVLVSPAFGATLLPGQLSAWIAAGIVGGVVLMETHAALAGVILGFVSIKPHLFLLIPVALVAARAWTTLRACLATAVVLVAISLLMYGWTPWMLWVQGATGPSQVIDGPHYTRYAATMGSVLDTVKALGAPSRVAWLAQLASAVIGTGAVWFVFRRTAARAPRLLILSAATLVVTPYWLNYDLLLPTLGIAVAATEDATAEEVPGEKIVWLFVWMLPYAMYLVRGLYGLPIGAAGMIAMLLVTLRRHELASTRIARQL